MTTSQLRDMLIERIGQHVKDPNVRVLITNFHVNVMGEVRNPTAYMCHRSASRYSTHSPPQAT